MKKPTIKTEKDWNGDVIYTDSSGKMLKLLNDPHTVYEGGGFGPGASRCRPVTARTLHYFHKGEWNTWSSDYKGSVTLSTFERVFDCYE